MNALIQKAKNIEIKTKAENRGLRISEFSSIFFIVLELLLSYYSNSKAVLMDGLFDACEAILLFISIKMMNLLYKPASEKRPFGYSNLEPLYMILKGFLFCAIAVIMIISSISSLKTGGEAVDLDAVFYFELFAGLFGLGILIYMKRLNKNANSPILLLEIKEWGFDAVSSLGLGAAFLLAMFLENTRFHFILRYFDQIMMLILTVYFLPTPIRAIKSGVRELFFLSPTEEILDEVKNAAYEVASKHGFKKEDLDFDVVKTGRRLWISIYLAIENEFIELAQLKRMQEELETRYALLSDIVDVDLIPDF